MPKVKRGGKRFYGRKRKRTSGQIRWNKVRNTGSVTKVQNAQQSKWKDWICEFKKIEKVIKFFVEYLIDLTYEFCMRSAWVLHTSCMRWWRWKNWRRKTATLKGCWMCRILKSQNCVIQRMLNVQNFGPGENLTIRGW